MKILKIEYIKTNCKIKIGMMKKLCYNTGGD
jgi:hypothetical protein